MTAREDEHANLAPPPLKQQLDTTDWLHPAPVPLASDLHRCGDILCFIRQRRPVDMLQHPQRLAATFQIALITTDRLDIYTSNGLTPAQERLLAVTARGEPTASARE